MQRFFSASLLDLSSRYGTEPRYFFMEFKKKRKERKTRQLKWKKGEETLKRPGLFLESEEEMNQDASESAKAEVDKSKGTVSGGEECRCVHSD